MTRKFSHFVPLSASDRTVLDDLASEQENVAADVDIVSEGTEPRSMFLIVEEMAVRYRGLPDGHRQIMTFLIPGDFCDIHVFLAKTMDRSNGTITPVRMAAIFIDRMIDVFTPRPRISAALWWSSMQEEAMLREGIASLGRRDAQGRIAYLLCELLWRHTGAGNPARTLGLMIVAGSFLTRFFYKVGYLLGDVLAALAIRVVGRAHAPSNADIISNEV